MLAVLAGCAGGEPAAAPTAAVTDSAGVRIVTNRGTEVPTWSLATPPTLRLGTVTDEGPEQFYRVSGGRLLADSGIAVVNGGSAEVRVFEADGSHRLDFGQQGEGPGEFRYPASLWELEADTLATWDARLRRLGLFSGSGDFGRFVTPDREILNGRVAGLLPGPRLLLRSELFDLPDVGFDTMDLALFLVGPDGETEDTLPTVPLGVYGRFGDVGLIGPPLFGAQTSVVGAAEAGYWVGTGRTEELRLFDLEGVLRRVVRWQGRDPTVSPAHVEAYRAELLASIPEEGRPRQRRIFEAQPVADRFPSHRWLHVGQDGLVWVETFRRPGDTGPTPWLVFDPDGRLLARIGIPEDDRILDSDEDRVLLVGRDSLDVEHVRVHRIVRPGR